MSNLQSVNKIKQGSKQKFNFCTGFNVYVIPALKAARHEHDRIIKAAVIQIADPLSCFGKYRTDIICIRLFVLY